MNDSAFSIKPSSINEDPWSSSIAQFLTQDWPIQSPDPSTTLESVSSIIFGTNQTRLGPLPSPESQVAMRKVMMYYIERSQPIPILTPWGSMKPGGARLDLAEVFGVKTIKSLNDRVTGVYRPGIQVHVRIEDAGGEWLFRNVPNAMEAQQSYVSTLHSLISIVSDGSIIPVLESNLPNYDKYMDECQELTPLFVNYIEITDHRGLAGNQEGMHLLSQLESKGWRGEISYEQRDFYRDRYRSLYPGRNDAHYTQLLAEYLAGSLAKKRLGLDAVKPEWSHGGFILLSLVPPVPGVPRSMEERRVYYRTLPAKYSRSHIAPWRARGYMKIDKSGSMTPKIVSPKEELSLHACDLVFGADDSNIRVQSEYELL